MSSTSEGREPVQGCSVRDRAVEAAGPGGTGNRDMMPAHGLGLGEAAGALGEQEAPGPGRGDACLYGGIPGQGKSGAVNPIAAELAARESRPHGRA